MRSAPRLEVWGGGRGWEGHKESRCQGTTRIVGRMMMPSRREATLNDTAIAYQMGFSPRDSK